MTKDFTKPYQPEQPPRPSGFDTDFGPGSSSNSMGQSSPGKPQSPKVQAQGARILVIAFAMVLLLAASGVVFGVLLFRDNPTSSTDKGSSTKISVTKSAKGTDSSSTDRVSVPDDVVPKTSKDEPWGK